MKCEMTEEEVRRDYRLSKDPQSQIYILAQINMVKPDTIRRVIGGETWEDAIFRSKQRATKTRKNKEWKLSDIQLLRKCREERMTYGEISAILNCTPRAAQSMYLKYNTDEQVKKKYPFAK